jgi:hypothetical protein
MTATLRPQPRLWAVALLVLLGLRCVTWRVTDTLNLSTPLAAAISVTALLAELLLLAGGSLNLLFSLWLPRRATEPPPPPACLRACLELDHDRLTV